MENMLGKNIVNRRHELKMTQQTLAERSDLSINFISRLERGGSNNVSSATLYKLALALQTSMDSLMIGPAKATKPHPGPYLTKLIYKLEAYDANKSEQLSKNILELLEAD